MNFMSGRPGAGGGGFYEEISSSDGGEFPPNYPYSRNQPYSVSNAGAGEETGEDQAQYGGGGAGGVEGSSGGRAAVIEREHMFDKVVTPSDVGKLNRLVIPKQHAEKYFPLDSTAHEKGLLLNFEDRNGKPWRFRYSYWNSSQSYVMTKGWSRFVKEKKLDAGDIVSFQRGVGDHAKDRLFIDWRRRPDAPGIPPPPTFPIPIQFPSYEFSFHRPWTNPFFMHPPQPPRSDYSHFLHHHHPSAYGGGSAIVNGNPCPPGSIVYLRSSGAEAFTTAGRQFEIGSGGGGGAVAAGGQQTVFNAVPVVQGKAAAKRLRLFGVNMDCPISDESDDCEMLASTNSTVPLPLPPPDDYSSPSSSTFPRHSDHNDKGKGSISLDLDI